MNKSQKIKIFLWGLAVSSMIWFLWLYSAEDLMLWIEDLMLWINTYGDMVPAGHY